MPGVHCYPFEASALSNNDLMASDFDGFGSGCAWIQASSLASSSGGIRKPRIG